ncbi:MAG: hypothetical protein ABSF97_10020 [Candidatus Sulfotelmatobacter sp.]
MFTAIKEVTGQASERKVCAGEENYDYADAREDRAQNDQEFAEWGHEYEYIRVHFIGAMKPRAEDQIRKTRSGYGFSRPAKGAAQS